MIGDENSEVLMKKLDCVFSSSISFEDKVGFTVFLEDKELESIDKESCLKNLFEEFKEEQEFGDLEMYKKDLSENILST